MLPMASPFDRSARRREVSEEGIAGIPEWRQQHPQARLQEIEAAADARFAGLHTGMLQDVASAS
jgi:hypothetical protein